MTQTTEATALEPHQLRVVAEKAELDDRRAKLAAFIGSMDWALIDPVDRLLLHEQARFMEDLSFILGKRIARFAPAAQSQWQAEMAARAGTPHHPV